MKANYGPFAHHNLAPAPRGGLKKPLRPPAMLLQIAPVSP